MFKFLVLDNVVTDQGGREILLVRWIFRTRRKNVNARTFFIKNQERVIRIDRSALDVIYGVICCVGYSSVVLDSHVQIEMGTRGGK